MRKMNKNNIIGLTHLFDVGNCFIAVGDKEKNGYSCNCLMINKINMECEQWQPYLKEHIDMLNNAIDILDN